VSFVLEALKKQEAGQDPDAAVSLARQAVERRRYRLWAGLFAVAVVVNAGMLLWTFGLPGLRPADRPGTGPLPKSAESAPATATAPTDDPPAAVPASADEPAPEDVTATPAPQGPVPAPAPRIRHVSLANLPADARERFPGIAFSTHVYSADAELRAIVANGQRLQEGDRVRGLEIVAITEGGVVLAFENYRVEVPIVTDW